MIIPQYPSFSKNLNGYRSHHQIELIVKVVREQDLTTIRNPLIDTKINLKENTPTFLIIQDENSLSNAQYQSI